uniref:Uncharacterized protein n=1 Tax=Populus trichocarpa TaxID=3694 RepID=A0A2K2AC67_POPTR
MIPKKASIFDCFQILNTLSTLMLFSNSLCMSRIQQIHHQNTDRLNIRTIDSPFLLHASPKTKIKPSLINS